MDTAQFLIDLRVQRDRINQAIEAIETLNGTAIPQRAAKNAKTAAPAAVKSVKAASVAPPAAKKRVISPEGRQRMAEAQQKRWAKKNKAAKA